MNEELITEAKKHRVALTKFVSAELPGGREQSAKKILEIVQKFLDDNKIDDAEFIAEVDGCGGCGGYFNGFHLKAYVEKTEAELQTEIESMKRFEAEKKKEYRNNKKLREEYERKEFARLKKKYG
jgi:hypothetical protein